MTSTAPAPVAATPADTAPRASRRRLSFNPRQSGIYVALLSGICATLLIALLFVSEILQLDHAYGATVLFFLAAYLSLGVMFWPYMIPYSVTVADAAAPDASLRFLFYGGVVVLPVIAIYTIGVYWVFRGKVRTSVGGRQ